MHGGKQAVKDTIAAVLIGLCLAATSVSAQEAMHYYNRGLESSLAYKRVEYFTKALHLDPNLAEAYEKRAIHYFFQVKLDKAIQDYTRVVELKPNSPEAYKMRGMAYLKKGHSEGFRAELERLAYHYWQLGVSQSDEFLARAIEDFTRAIELNPQAAKPYSYRAKAYRLVGMIDEAIRDATEAIELQVDPQSSAMAHQTLAEIYRRLGQTELYEANLLRSIELDPYSPDYPPLHVPLSVRDARDASTLKGVGRVGLLGIIILTFVVIFRVTLKAPRKRDEPQ